MGISRHAGSALIAVCGVVLGACSNAPSIGGRPLIYPNQRGDVTEEKAGIVRKVAPSETAPPERSAANAPAAPAPRAPEPIATPPPAPPAAMAQAAPAPSRSAPAAGDESVNRYTQATRYGDLLFVSGQIAIDLRNGAFDSRQDVAAQTRAALENIRAILESHRLTMANVVSTTVYLSKISDLPTMDAAYREFFRGTPPARS